MPRNTRNFWVDLHIDGRSSNLAGGPVSKDGDISGTIYVRNNGGVVKGLEIWGHAKKDGTLELGVHPGEGVEVEYTSPHVEVLKKVREFWAGGDCPEELWNEINDAINYTKPSFVVKAKR